MRDDVIIIIIKQFFSKYALYACKHDNDDSSLTSNVSITTATMIFFYLPSWKSLTERVWIFFETCVVSYIVLDICVACGIV